MATKRCHQCRSEVDALAKVCPHCRVKLGLAGRDGIAKKPTGIAMGCLFLILGLFALGVLGQVIAGLTGSTANRVPSSSSGVTTGIAAATSVGASTSTSAGSPSVVEDRMAQWRGLPPAEHIRAAEEMLKSSRDYWAKHPNKKGKEPVGPLIQAQDWAPVVQRLELIGKEQREYARAQTLRTQIETEQKKGYAAYAAIDAWKKAVEQKNSAGARKVFASSLEESFLQKRMNTDVTAVGSNNTILRIKWALASKVTARDLENSGILDKARKEGFVKLIFTDGYYFGYQWEL